MLFKEGGQILKKCRPPWLADEENLWSYFALDGLILNCFMWNRRLSNNKQYMEYSFFHFHRTKTVN